MNKNTMFSKFCLIILMTLIYFSKGAAAANAVEITEDELLEFRVTIYNENEQIPLDNLLTYEGKIYDNKALQGRYVLINFWATWCPFCQREMRSKQQLYDEIAVGWFILLTISVGEEVDTVASYMKENGFNLPVVFDPDNELKDIYAPRIPTSYVLDPEGNIIARINGSKEWDSEQALKILRYLIPDANE